MGRVGSVRIAWMVAAVLGASVPAVLLARGVRAKAERVELPRYGLAPEFTLVSQGGETFRSDQLRGRVWIADFVFTSCTESCPMLTTRMKSLERRLAEAGDDRASPRVRLLSFTVDPERDTPERLAVYAASWGARPPSWTFLTGSNEALQRVVTAGLKQGVTWRAAAGDGRDIVHANRFVLVD